MAGSHGLYLGFGFEQDEGGNHTTYVHPQYNLITQVPRGRKLAPFYAREAVRLIEELKALEAKSTHE